jgi:hypothetical protein
LWYLSVLAVTVQAVLSLTLLYQQFRKRLGPASASQVVGASANSGSVLTPPSDH